MTFVIIKDCVLTDSRYYLLNGRNGRRMYIYIYIYTHIFVGLHPDRVKSTEYTKYII